MEYKFLVTSILENTVEFSVDELVEWGYDPSEITNKQLKDIAIDIAMESGYHWWDDVDTDAELISNG